MALTIQRVPDGEDAWGRFRVKVVDLILDTSYPAGGYVVNASDVGMKMVYGAQDVGGNAASGIWNFLFDVTSALATALINGLPATSFKLRLFNGVTIATEAVTASNVSGVTVRVMVVGR